MILGKVIGTLLATQKNESMKSFKFQVIQPLNAKREHAGLAIVAVDTVGAGKGETAVYINHVKR